MHRGGEVQQLGSGQALVEIELLRQHTDPLLDLEGLFPGFELADSGGALVRAEETHDHLDRGGLAGPVLPKQSVELTWLDRQVDPVDRGFFPKPSDQALGPDCRRGLWRHIGACQGRC